MTKYFFYLKHVNFVKDKISLLLEWNIHLDMRKMCYHEFVMNMNLLHAPILNIYAKCLFVPLCAVIYQNEESW